MTAPVMKVCYQKRVREVHPAVAHSDPVRGAFNNVPAAVAAVCAQVGGRPVGIVATSLAVGVSYEPPMISLAVLKSSTTWPVLRRTSRLGVSVLSQAQAAAGRQIASKSGDRFADVPVWESAAGAVFLHDAVTWFESSVQAELSAGDHHVVLLEVHGVSVLDEHPLIFHRATFHRLVVPIGTTAARA